MLARLPPFRSIAGTLFLSAIGATGTRREARFAVRAALALREGPSCNRGDDQHFIPILEVILLVAEKADVFLVHVKVDEAANLTLLVAQI